MSDPRSVLEAIAYSDDPQIAPADRVRALSELRALGEPLDLSFYRELQGLCACGEPFGTNACSQRNLELALSADQLASTEAASKNEVRGR